MLDTSSKYCSKYYSTCGYAQNVGYQCLRSYTELSQGLVSPVCVCVCMCVCVCVCACVCAYSEQISTHFLITIINANECTPVFPQNPGV